MSLESRSQAQKLMNTINQTGLAQVVSITDRDDRISLLCRVLPGAEQKWLILLTNLLKAAEGEAGQPHAWQSHFCKHFFLKDNKLVFGWNISIQSELLAESIEFILACIETGDSSIYMAEGPTDEVMSMPLTGITSNDRNIPKKGKGVVGYTG